MNAWIELDRVATACGDDIALRRRGDVFEIRFNGLDLMSSFNHQSETALADRSLRLCGRAARRILIGGLGMGFTLRAALDCADPEAQVVVSELVPQIIAWNRRYFGHLAGHPLDDRRVRVEPGDVVDLLGRAGERYDVILMDTDNGPDLTVRPTNDAIYSAGGLDCVRRSLNPGGVASFWSSTISEPFEERLDAVPWRWRRHDVRLIGGRVDAFHYIYCAETGPCEGAAPGDDRAAVRRPVRQPHPAAVE